MSELNQTTVGVPDGIRMAQVAFLRDFTSLMANRKTRGKYVCYHKDQLVAVTNDYRAIIQEVVTKGWPRDESLILKVVPGEDRAEQDILDEAEINPD